MSFRIVLLSSFERDLERYVTKGGNYDYVQEILHQLASGKSLPHHLRDHKLQGKLRNCRELHVEHDILLVYEKNGRELVVTCMWLVSHDKLRQRERKL